MPDVIFNNKVGYGSSVSGFSSFPITLQIPGQTEDNPFTEGAKGEGGGDTPYDLHTVIITSIGTAQASNFQFMQTLNNHIFVYVFGDKVGQIQVTGLMFAGDCTRGKSDGFSNVLKWFKENKISSKNNPGEPITITVGKTSFTAFLINVKTSVDRPVEGLGTFTLTFLTTDY